MEFARRLRSVFVQLDPEEIGLWRLPPITPGVIQIKVFAVPGVVPEEDDDDGDPSPRPAGSGSGSGGTRPGGLGSLGTIGTRVPARGRSATPAISLPARDATPAVSVPARDAAVDGSRPGGVLHLDQPRRPRAPGGLLGEDLVVDPGMGGGPATDIKVELLRGGQPVKEDANHVLHEQQFNADVWALRITRLPRGATTPQRYRIEVSYPSALPIETRRIPEAFFTRGFDQNWNDNPYIEAVKLRGNKLEYSWNRKFAELYHHDIDRQYITLAPDWLKLPELRQIGVRLRVGSMADPSALLPGQPRPQRFFIAIRIDCEFAGSRQVELDIPGRNPDLITLPDPLWFEVRLVLMPFGRGTLGYSPQVFSPLLNTLDINVSYPSLSEGITTVNVKQTIEKAVEDHLYRLQFSSEGNRMDGYLRPWLVGRYELWDIVHEENGRRREVVVEYVGRRPPPQDPRTVVVDTVSGGGAPDPSMTADRLFTDDDARREWPRPAPMPDPLDRPHRIDPGALSKIDHIVVLMQENRSFDQVLGYLSRDGMLPRNLLLTGGDDALREAPQDHVNGLLAGDNPRDAIQYPEGSAGDPYRSRRRRTTAWPRYSLENPCHGHACVETQIADGMKGFVADYASRLQASGEATRDNLQLIMDYLTDAELPTYGALTREFAICDAWFCSHIGGTLPNRFISLTGDFSEDVHGSPELENPDLIDGFAPIEAKTFFDHLSARGVSWKLFEHGYSMLRLIRNFTFDETNIEGFNDPDDGFVATALAGRLPAVTFIEPDYIEAPDGNDDHAPADMINGQRFIATIVDALIRSPQWERTMFIITYDEHGGFYDHEPLPYRVRRDVNGTPVEVDIPPLASGERRPGVRVPAFVISPFIPPMSDNRVNVAKAFYDHTTIPATILRRFCGPTPPRMSPRADGAADLRDLLTLDTPRPRSDFDQLVVELQQIAGRAAVGPNGDVPAVPLRRPKDEQPLEDDFHGLIAFATSITGRAR